MSRPLQEILADLERRTLKGHSKYYKPLEDPSEQVAVRKYYQDSLLGLSTEDLQGGRDYLFSQDQTPISIGWSRVVIGDFGPFIEIKEGQILKVYLRPKWPGSPARPVKYIWLETIGPRPIKVYWQQGRVKYADYLPGYYYVAPIDVYILRRNDIP